MGKEEKEKIELDPDFIYCPSCNNSLEKFALKHPDGVNDERAAQVLMITPDKVREYYAQAVKMMREDMGVENDSEEEK